MENEEEEVTDVKIYSIYKNDLYFIKKCSRKREWMDNTQDQYAYRCLPLAMANMNGYELCCSKEIKIIWNGGQRKEDLLVKSEGHVATSLFMHGIVTFHTNILIRTPKNINTYVSGPINNPKRGIYPLTGIVETDWNPATFTMNWMMTEPNHQVIFRAGEPFCNIHFIPRGFNESLQPVIDNIESNKEEFDDYKSFEKSRNEFHKNPGQGPDSWQKHYYKGIYHDGRKCPVNHQTKLDMKDAKTSKGCPFKFLFPSKKTEENDIY